MNTLEVQIFLERLGYTPGKADGLIGPNTTRAMIRFLEDVVPELGPVSTPRLVVATEQAIMREIAGIDPGKIDGFVGPVTIQARTQWDARGWRFTLDKPLETDDRFPEAVRTTWPRQPDVERFFGKVGENQTMLHTPFPLRIAWDTKTVVHRFSIHEKVHDSAERVFGRILDHYGEAEITRLGIDLFGGCLNVRKMRGGSAWSMHAWGIAIDVDPARNQLRWGKDRAQLSKPEYAEFWKFWTDEGWLSLGKARNYDWMHVQAARL